MFPSMARQINWKNTTGNYCLIPRSWYTDWRNYIETPEIEDRPPPIGLFFFLLFFILLFFIIFLFNFIYLFLF